jgi:multiple sugar transport system permease protein
VLRLRASRLPVHLLLILGAVGMLLPFFWMVSTALKTPAEAIEYPPTWIPKDAQPSNFGQVFRKIDLPRYFLNTVVITLGTLLGILFTGMLAAYAFARFEFPGRELLFMGFLGLMMIPLPVYLVPSYMVLFRLGWIDTFLAMIVPWTVNIFAIFLLRQHFRTIPQDLFDAARIDGCSRFWMLWRVVLPLSRPQIVTIVVFDVIASWNSFLWPLIVTHSDRIRPLQVGLAYFARSEGTNYSLLMAASTLTILPLVILFFFAQKQIIQSYARSGLKE